MLTDDGRSAQNRTHVLVIAAHHASDNVASNRFRGLLRHFDSSRFRVTVLSRSNTEQDEASSTSPDDIPVYALGGRVVGPDSGALDMLRVFSSSILPRRFPQPVSGRDEAPLWLGRVLAQGERLLKSARRAGESSIIVASYSPIDAHVAASLLAGRAQVPYVLDFRDGFVFESLGRSGGIASTIRRVVEAQLVRRASLVTTVSRPIVTDFRKRYPGVRVELLPNGFDPETPAPVLATRASLGAPPGTRVVGHFGRLGASEGERTESLRHFGRALEDLGPQARHWHLVFVGDLTDPEIEMISRLPTTSSISGPVPRSQARDMMRACDRLLLLTGSAAGVATGKLFDYMTAGPEVVCISMVRNEAMRIIEETGIGQSFTIDDPRIQSAFLPDSVPATVRREDQIALYDRRRQSEHLAQMLDSINK